MFDRAPAVQPTAFGLAVAERWSRALPALPG
jgi:hypothetical protein